MLKYKCRCQSTGADLESRYDWLSKVRNADRVCLQHGTDNTQKQFTDSVNGKSGLTYWDALESEVR